MNSVSFAPAILPGAGGLRSFFDDTTFDDLAEADSFSFVARGATSHRAAAAAADVAPEASGAGGALWASLFGDDEGPAFATETISPAAASVDLSTAAVFWVEQSAVLDVSQGIVLDSYISGQGANDVFSDFNIEIIFEGTWSEALQAAFIKSAEYLSSIITGDVRGGGRQGIDDIRINATLDDIDGPGGVLGQAGPTGLRFFSKLPKTAIMEFDVADANNFDGQNLFDDIVLHEMMHSLGFGTIWAALGLTEGSVRNGDIVFTGENAILAYNTELADIAANDPNSLNGVPVETDGGPGTAGGHWDDDTFDNELMTGYISDPNYVSSMTVAAFEDMGYDTVWNAADPTALILQPDDVFAVA